MIEKVNYYYHRLIYYLRNKHYNVKDSKRIAIIYFIPKTNKEKHAKWKDGFTEAIKILEDDYLIDWININDKKPTVKE